MKKEIKKPSKNKVDYTYKFTVNRSDELLVFLLSKLDLSRTTVKNLLSNNKIVVNGNVVRQFNYPLAKDDEIKVMRNSQNVDFKKRQKEAVKNSKFKENIIFENETYIAINKPSGLLSVESDKEKENAYSILQEALKTKDKTKRIYSLHRIDKETSGVLVFSKDIKAHSMLKTHWNEDIKLREYYCIVNGTLEKKEDTIISFLKENKNNKVYSTKDPKGKKAITNYEVVKENGLYSLLRVTIDTGRKNQIRCHMNDINHPILGDDKYEYIESPIGRLCLHASRLDFFDPISKSIISIKAPVPHEFMEVFR